MNRLSMKFISRFFLAGAVFAAVLAPNVLSAQQSKS